MRPARILMTLLLALSIAVLPALGGAVSVVKAVESMAATELAAEACCELQAEPCDARHQQNGSMGDCASLAVCAAKCFVYAGVAAIGPTCPDVIAVALTDSCLPAFESHIEPPPFPPPRV
jgi:hypothetical protein